MKIQSTARLLSVLAMLVLASLSAFAQDTGELNIFVKFDGAFLAGKEVKVSQAGAQTLLVTDSAGKAGPFTLVKSKKFNIRIEHDKNGNGTIDQTGDFGEILNTNRIIGASNTNMRATAEFQTGKRVLFTFTKMNTGDTTGSATQCLVTVSFKPLPAWGCSYKLVDANGSSYGDGVLSGTTLKDGTIVGKSSAIYVPRGVKYSVEIFNGATSVAQKDFVVRKFDTRKTISLRAEPKDLTQPAGDTGSSTDTGAAATTDTGTGTGTDSGTTTGTDSSGGM
ncbi:MAG: hypothetical protein HQM10_07900 [Candidatus Riflebacteria bacterium]|nr:hypothetical protein [Candidatus Riflebacteria bacterium]